MSHEAKEILDRLRAMGSPENVAGMARYGIQADKAFGVKVKDLRGLAKELGRDHALALGLWASEVHEARMLACMLEEPGELSEQQMDAWIKDFDSWDLCDTCTGSLFDKHPRAYEKAIEWSQLEPEFERRAGFAMMAWLAVHDKKAPNKQFEVFFPFILEASVDERNFVKKAVNWALRQIGKRNLVMRKRAIQISEEIQEIDSKAARWIAADALRELNKASLIERLEKKAAK